MSVLLKNGFLTKELIELLLESFFSCGRNQERFLEEFSNSSFQQILKGTTLKKVIKSGTLARKILVDLCFEEPQVLEKIALLRGKDGFEMPNKITKKELALIGDKISLTNILWGVAAGEIQLTEGALKELKDLLTKSPLNFPNASEESLKTEKQKAKKSEFLLRENLLLKERIKKLKKENRKLKKETKALSKEVDFYKNRVNSQKNKCKVCGKKEILKVVSDVKGINFEIQKMIDMEDYGNLGKLIKEKEKLLKSLKNELKKVGSKVNKIEKQICRYGQPKLILIDGHNLIFRGLDGVRVSDKEMLDRKILLPDFERISRNKLILKLYYAAERLNCKMKVYFDSGSGDGFKRLERVEIFYCFKLNGGADFGLKKEIGKIKRGENVLVFTSDRKHICSYVQKLKSKGKTVNCDSVELLSNYLSELEELLNLEDLTDPFFLAWM